MGSLILKGQSSGEIALTPPSVAGASTLLLPAGNDTLVTLNGIQTLTNKTIAASQFTGSISASALPAGSIIQAVQGSYTTQTSFAGNGTTFFATGLSASITPSSTSNKILALVTIGVFASSTANVTAAFQLQRGGTPVGNGVPSGSRQGALFRLGNYTGDGNHGSGLSFSYLDSPSSTSALTYTVNVEPQNGQTFYINYTGLNSNNSDSYATYVASYIILLEVKG